MHCLLFLNKKPHCFRILPEYGTLTDEVLVTACPPAGACIDRVEHVQVFVRMTTKRRGDVQISLTSPAGTRYSMVAPDLPTNWFIWSVGGGRFLRLRQSNNKLTNNTYTTYHYSKIIL